MACGALGMAVEFTPKRKSYLKGAVERTFRTINKDNFQNVRGTTFSNYLKRHEYKPEKDTFATETGIRHAMGIFVTEIYHVGMHPVFPMQRIDVWCKHVGEFPPRMPPKVNDLNVALARERDAKQVHHYGVEIDYLRYSGPGVDLIRNHRAYRPKKNYRVKVYPDDVTKISVLNDDGHWVDLLADDRFEIAGFSIVHWATLRRFTLKEFRQSIKVVTIARAIGRFQEVLSASIKRHDKHLSKEFHKSLKLAKAVADRDAFELDPLETVRKAPSEKSRETARPSTYEEPAEEFDDDDDDDEWEVEVDD
jgi:putative transposase